jgi:hypothetical protein
MRLISRPRPSPAMIVAALALTLALAGTAIAAPDIATRAVTKSKVKKIAKKQAKKQINKLAPGLSVNHANTADTASPTGPAGGDLTGTYPNPLIGDQKVTTNKIANAAVTNTKIADAAVTTNKIADAAVTTQKLAGDSITTDKILNGQVQGPDLANVAVRTAVDANVPSGQRGIAVANCLGNEVRLSGGAFWTAALSGNKGLQATFATGQSSWVGIGRNQTGTPQDWNVQVLCLQG